MGRRNSFPISSSARVPEIIEPEMRSKAEIAETNPNDLIKVKFAESIPDLIQLVSSYLDIKKIEGQAKASADELRAQGEFLNRKADAFIKIESAKRQTWKTLGDTVQGLLGDFYTQLNKTEISDERAKEMIAGFNKIVEMYIEQSVRSNESETGK